MVNPAAEAYRRQQILTATPETLTYMLYNGALRFMKEGSEAIVKKDFEKGNSSLQKAQNIIAELRTTLNMDYEIAHQLLPLYNYVYDKLVEANIKSSPELIGEALEIVTELRDAWGEAMKKARQEKSVAHG